MTGHRFDGGTWEQLRGRRSIKWRAYPPDVLPAWVAEMDFPLARPIAEALHAAVDRDDTGYAYFDGFAEAVAGFLADRLTWTVDPALISAVPDVMAGVGESLRLLTDPDAGVVINPPVYPPFAVAIRAAGRRVVEVPLGRAGAAHLLDLDALERAFAADAVQAYLLCSPHNPTGLVFSRTELQAVAALARRYDIAVVADEIHAPLALPGAGFTAYLSLEQAAPRAVSLVSASKAFNLAGLKCAALVAGDADVLALTASISPEVRFRTGLFGVLASIAAFRDGGPWLDEVLGYLDGNRRLLGDLLAQRLPAARWAPPQASYLAWLDLSAYDLGPDPAAVLLAQGRVALSPGPDFGALGSGFARLNFATPAHLLTEAVDRMAAAVAGQPVGGQPVGGQPMASPTASSRP